MTAAAIADIMNNRKSSSTTMKGTAAKRSRGAGFNHLTLVVRGGQVVTWGFNSLCSGQSASVHSEVNALRALFSHLKGGGRSRYRCGRRNGGASGGSRGGGGRRGRGRSTAGGGGRYHLHEEGYDLVNVRYTFDALRISRPCRRCWLFLGKHLWRFRRVMYTTSEGVIVCMSSEEFAAQPPEHVSKGHRLNYYTASSATAASTKSVSSSSSSSCCTCRGGAASCHNSGLHV